MNNEKLEKLNTEQVNENSKNIDELDTKEILKIINEEDQKVAKAVQNEIDDITMLTKEVTKAISNGNKIIYIGAGTSGRLGFMDAVECPPTYGVDDDLFISLLAGGQKAMKKAVEGAEDSFDLGEEDLRNVNIKKGDVVIGLAASGRTPYVIGGIDYAKKQGIYTGAIVASKNSKVKEHADICIEVDVGPEVISGSTRMKAGTAQKLVLNMISTTSMIENGKVYNNLMVDVKTSNYKLEQRAILIVQRALNIEYEEAKELLNESKNNIKVAIVMKKLNINKNEAKKLLDQSNGFIKKINGITNE